MILDPLAQFSVWLNSQPWWDGATVALNQFATGWNALFPDYPLAMFG